MAEPDGTFSGRDIIKLLVYAEAFRLECRTHTTRQLIWSGGNRSWLLRKGNWIVAKLLKLLHNTCSLSDCGCTFRLTRRHALELIVPHLRVTGPHFLPEIVLLAHHAGLCIIEIPVNYRARVGVSKITGSWRGIL